MDVASNHPSEHSSTGARHAGKFAFLATQVAFPVALGAAIYSLWRSDRLLVFTWYRWLGLSHAVLVLRAYAASAKAAIPAFVLYSIPDALWVYAFTIVLLLIWEPYPPTGYTRMWPWLPVVLAIGGEVGQGLHVVPGTFDWGDVAAYLVAWLLAIFVFRRYRRVRSMIQSMPTQYAP